MAHLFGSVGAAPAVPAVISSPYLDADVNIWTAAGDGQIDVIRAMLAGGVPPAIQDDNGYTALCVSERRTPSLDRGRDDRWAKGAVGGGLAVGVVPGAGMGLGAENDWTRNPSLVTCRHAAASYGHDEILRLLIDAGGDVNVRDADGDTPLHACEFVRCAKTLLDHGADPTLRNAEDKTPVDVAVEDERRAMVIFLRRLLAGGMSESKTGEGGAGTSGARAGAGARSGAADDDDEDAAAADGTGAYAGGAEGEDEEDGEGTLDLSDPAVRAFVEAHGHMSLDEEGRLMLSVGHGDDRLDVGVGASEEAEGGGAGGGGGGGGGFGGAHAGEEEEEEYGGGRTDGDDEADVRRLGRGADDDDAEHR